MLVIDINKELIMLRLHHLQAQKKLIKKLEGISDTGVADNFIYLYVDPSIGILKIMGLNSLGRSSENSIKTSNYIDKLKVVEKNKNWLSNLNALEEKLVEKKTSGY